MEVNERDVLAVCGALAVENQLLKERAQLLLGENRWLELALMRLVAIAVDSEEQLKLTDEEAEFLRAVRAKLNGKLNGIDTPA